MGFRGRTASRRGSGEALARKRSQGWLATLTKTADTLGGIAARVTSRAVNVRCGECSAHFGGQKEPVANRCEAPLGAVPQELLLTRFVAQAAACPTEVGSLDVNDVKAHLPCSP